jgi:hypothetical protein
MCEMSSKRLKSSRWPLEQRSQRFQVLARMQLLTEMKS